MLSNRLQADLSTLTSALKDDMSAQLTDTSENFLSECQEIASRYDHSSRPKDSEVYQAALLYLSGQIGEDIDYLYELVAFGLYMPIESMGNKCVAYDQRKLAILLNRYRDEAKHGRLWEMTWLGVLQAYFQAEVRMGEQSALLNFLQDTYRDVVGALAYRPLWRQVLEKNPALLAKEPFEPYIEEWLAGNEAPLRQIARDLQIPDKGWFWPELTAACVNAVTDRPDAEFKRLIPNLLCLLEKRPETLDENLNAILSRYNQCSDKGVHDELKDFSLRYWKNPKLRHAGESKWQRVRLPVWQMVLGWVSDAHLQVFFEKISARYSVSKDRLSSWLRYIAWTKFVAHYEANPPQQSNPDIIRLFEVEEEALASAAGLQDKNLDVFIRRIGEYMATA